MSSLQIDQAVLWDPKSPSPSGVERAALARFGPIGWRVAFIGYGGVMLSHPRKTQADRPLWVDVGQVRAFRYSHGETT